MHTAYLGIGRDLVSSLLGDFIDHGVLGGGSIDDQLARLSREMQQRFKTERYKTQLLKVFIR